MKEDSLFKENMKSFGEYEPYVRKWCKKYEMAYVMEEFKELFDWIRIMDKKPISTQASPKKAQSYNKCFTATDKPSPKSCLDCKYENYFVSDAPCKNCWSASCWKRKTS